MRTYDGNAKESIELKLQTILALFSGREANFPMTTTAVTLNGICAYLGILTGPTASPEDVGRIHVLTGKIEYQKKAYDRVEDRVRLEKEELQNFDLCKKVLSFSFPFSEYTLSIRERAERLDCLLEIRPGENVIAVGSPVAIPVPLRVGPGILSTMLGNRRGLVSCSRGKVTPNSLCKTVRPELVSPEILKTAEVEDVGFRIGDRQVDIFHCADSRQAVAVAAAAARATRRSCEIYIRRDECVRCCVAAVMENTHPSRTHFAIILLRGRG
jgi:hypothetical protein